MDYLVKSTKWTKHNGYVTWWGPNRSGYTDLICEAGIYSEDEAKYLEKTHGSNICVAVPYDEKMVKEAAKQQEIIISNCEQQIERYKEYIKCEETRIGKANQIKNKLKERIVSYCEEQYISALVKENKELKEQLNEIKSNKLNSMQIKVEVDTTEVDAAMKKATELLNVYKKIDILQARITRGSEIIEACAKKYSMFRGL